jgi:hypothetical protein
MDLTNEKPLLTEEDDGVEGYIYPTDYGDTYKGYECVRATRAQILDGKCSVCDIRYKPECSVLSCHTAKGSLSDFEVVWRKLKQ